MFVGGKSLLSQQEHDEIRAEVDAEFDAGERKMKKKNSKTTKKIHVMEDDMGSLFGGGITGKLPRFANRITLKVCAHLLFAFRLC